MGTQIPHEVRVERTERDGWYIYKSEQLPGLYVAGPNDRVAYDDVPASVTTLLGHSHGGAVDVVHGENYDSFLSKNSHGHARLHVTLFVHNKVHATVGG